MEVYFEMNGENESIGIKITSFLFLRYPFLNFFERVSQVSLIEFRNISKFDIPFFDHSILYTISISFDNNIQTCK